jgi:acyl-CoA hydrolase
MPELEAKRVSDSKTEHVQILMPEHINGYGRLFGGKLVEWIDVVAGVVARRHSGRNVTTLYIDNLHFKAAAYANDTVVLVGRVTYVGRTSMEVRVDTFVESLSREKRLVNRAYFVMVALDEDEKPVQVPGLIPETDEDRLEWEAGAQRTRQRKLREAGAV